MAGALRPVVLLMLLASVLFVLAGALDGVYPGGDSWSISDLAWLSYLFAIVNTLVAVLVARGSERSLALRMGLSLFFVFERPASAFLFETKTLESIAAHIFTALVELIILVSAVRVWQLGHSVESESMDQLFSIEAPMPSSSVDQDEPDAPATTLSGRSSWLIGISTLLLAASLVADGVLSGYLPDGRAWGVAGESSGWIVYLFAVVLLTVATRAVKGGRLALRLLGLTALIFFVERAFSPFALRIVDPLALALHGAAAFVALAVALSAASAIRETAPTTERDIPTLEAA